MTASTIASMHHLVGNSVSSRPLASMNVAWHMK